MNVDIAYMHGPLATVRDMEELAAARLHPGDIVVVMGPSSKRGTAVVEAVDHKSGIVRLNLDAAPCVTDGDYMVKVEARPSVPLMTRGI